MSMRQCKGILKGMNTNRKAVETFLEKVNMSPEAIVMETLVSDMIKEMTLGLNGEPSSLPMLPTYVDANVTIPLGESTVVLDAGGTNLRKALVSFQGDGSPAISKFSKYPMPGTQGKTVGREEFFNTLALLVKPLLSHSHRVGFCFSYPTEIQSNKDGRLMFWSKEIQAPEVVGRMIGSDLKDALSNCGVKDLPEIVILNDTVATLLTGKSTNITRSWAGYVGFILGTGTNSSYVENNANISKVKNLDPHGTQIINCETGNYACGFRGDADVLLGKSTAKPELFWLEKMLSGAYFGALATQTTILAAQHKLFSPALIQALLEKGEFSTKDVDCYCHNPSETRNNALSAAMKEKASLSESERLWFLFNALLERAAKLSASNIAASILKGSTMESPLNPTCLTIDGTTYYRYYRFQHRVEHYLRPFLTERNHYYETVQVEDAPLIGAAVAALTNI